MPIHGFFLCLLLLVSTVSFAQEPLTSKSFSSKYFGEYNPRIDTTMHYKIMLIPFDGKMYMSDIDREVAAEEQLNFDQILTRLRNGLDAAVKSECRKNNKVFSMLLDTPDVKNDLAYIYRSIGYKYELLPAKAEQPGATKNQVKELFGQRKKQGVETPPVIQNGQIADKPDYNERFMKTTITDAGIFKYLSAKYGSEVYVFINQLDIQRDKNADQYAIANNNFKREIKVHYTVFDKHGKEIAAGAAYNHFPSQVYTTGQIVSHFPAIGKTIIETLPKPGKESSSK